MPSITNDFTSVIGGSGYDNATSVVVSSDGSIYVAGSTSKSFDGQVINGDTNAFVTKFSASGNKLWTRFLGSASTESTSIAVGSDGAIYLTGWTTATTLNSDSGSDGFISKISADGSIIWNKNVYSSGTDRLVGISASSDGFLYLTGKVNTSSATNGSLNGKQLTADSSILFVEKMSLDGLAQWTTLTSIPSPKSITPFAIISDSNYLYVCGATDSNLNGQVNSGYNDAFVSKYDTSGNLIWTRLLKSTGGDTATSIAADSNGNLYVAGYTFAYSGATINFESQQSSSTSGSFLTKLDLNGNSVWTRLLSGGSENSFGVTSLSDGSIWVTGQTTGNLGAQGQSNAGGTDGFICRYDTDGNRLFSSLIGGSSADFAFAIAANKASSKFYVVGQTYGSIGVTPYGATDAYLMGFTDGYALVASTVATPTYTLISALLTVNEGSTATFTLTTTNVASGTSISYTLSGVSGSDIVGGSTAGTTTVNSLGVAIISVSIAADGVTEGSETLTVTAQGKTATTVINDTSVATGPTFQIAATGSTCNEGDAAVFVVSTNSIKYQEGTQIAYSITGVSSEDLVNNLLVGSATIRSDGSALIYIYPKNDNLTEGAETLTINVEGKSASIIINDTSKSVIQSTYDLSSISSSVNEGGTARFLLVTANVQFGTTLTYTLSGVSSADLTSGSLIGSITTLTNGGANYIDIPIAADSLTEGTETLTISLQGKTASILINDTSKTAASPTYSLTSSSSSVNEGSVATFTLSTTNVASGTSVPYTLSGISAADVSGGSLSGNAVIDATGKAVISVSLVNDAMSEGTETLIVKAGTASAFLDIIDTSVSKYINYEQLIGLSNASGQVVEGDQLSIKVRFQGYTSGQLVPYRFDINPDDIVNGAITGFATVNGSIAYIPLNILADNSFEPLNEYFYLYVDNQLVPLPSVSNNGGIPILDTSYPKTAWSVSTSNLTVNEGQTVTFKISVNDYHQFGALFSYQLSNISLSDVGISNLIGTATTNSLGNYDLIIPINSDKITEGQEELVLKVYSFLPSNQLNETAGYGSIIIIDTSTTSVTPTYSLTANTSAANEGSIATFTLSTTNVAAGTTVNYALSGISSADLASGSLSGTATVASNGQATISVLLANDNLTEGTETLTVTAGGASASTQINDTSKAASPTYAVSTNWTSTTEGTPIVVTLSAANVSAGTTLYYQLSGSGITTSDFGGLSLTGSSVINSSGQASLTIPLSADVTTEGDETFVIQYYTDSGRSITAGSAAYVTIQDTSKGAVTPTYAVSANSSTVNEGSTASFTLYTTNVTAGIQIPFTFSGVSSSDLVLGYLSGTTTVDYDGKVTLNQLIANDNLTEGTETLTLTVGGASASIQIIDTSKATAIPTYNLVALGSSVNEGSVATFNLTTTGVSPGTSVPYTISGVSSSDVTGGLSGTATVDTNGFATIFVPLAADFLTESSETLTVTAQGKSASVVVNDTSKTTLTASYALSASTNSVSEGSSAVFTLTTTNVAGGTSIPYTISGVSSSDITGGALSGTAIVSSNGNATITIPLALDLTTEGTESLTVTAQGISESILISDTSTTPVVITPISSVASIPYGDGKYFYASTGSDKVTGTSFVDVVKQTSTISSNQLTKLSDGSWQVQNKITPSNSDNLVNVERIEFSDMSVALDVAGPAGQVAKILGSVFGQSYVSNTVFAGIGFAYLDGGMSYLDLCGLAAGAAGLSTPDLLVTNLLRNTTGTEPTALSKSSYLQSISNGASYASVVQQIADSSANAQSIKLTDLANTGLAYTPYVLPPTYSLSAASASVDEGSTAVFNLTTTNVAVGTEVSYTLSGIGPADLTSGTITGKVSIGVGGTASISIPIAADGATEGQESLTISAQGATASIVINDTSKSIALPTYTLSPATLSVNEGELARVYVNTTNVAAGTALQYGVSGVSSSDVIGALTRLVNVDSLGQAFINIQTIADQITEGPETMYITLGTSTTSIIINDTSVTLVGIPEDGGGGGGGGGGGAGGD